MPFKDAVELLCDYLAAGRAYMGKNFSYEAEYEWWLKKSAKPMRMHPHTKTFITLVLGELHFLERVNVSPLKFFNKKKLKERYEKITDGGEFNDCGIL